MEYFEEKNPGCNPSRPGVYSCDKIALSELNPTSTGNDATDEDDGFSQLDFMTPPFLVLRRYDSRMYVVYICETLPDKAGAKLPAWHLKLFYSSRHHP